MPVYTMHVWARLDLSGQKRFANAMIALHAETFGTNPAAVRVEFVLAPSENTRFRYVWTQFHLSSLYLFIIKEMNLSLATKRKEILTPSNYASREE
jgi:hypothetical protein